MAGILLVHGHQVQAVRLRGHGQPPGRIWHRVHHHVEDVGVAAARFAEPPVLVGHSLGGPVVQKSLEAGPAQGAVLLAPVPPGGTIGAVARLAVRHPAVLASATVSLTPGRRPHPHLGPGNPGARHPGHRLGSPHGIRAGRLRGPRAAGARPLPGPPAHRPRRGQGLRRGHDLPRAPVAPVRAGLDAVLHATVRRWIEERWPFQKVAYPGRDG